MAYNTTKRIGEDFEGMGDFLKRARREDGGGDSGLGSGNDGYIPGPHARPDEMDLLSGGRCNTRIDGDFDATNREQHGCDVGLRNVPSVPATPVSSLATGAFSLEGTPEPGGSPVLICYGMVPRIKCQRLNEGEPDVDLSATGKTGSRPNYLPIALVVKHGRLVIGTHSTQELAHMNSKATFALLEALNYGAQLELYAKSDDLYNFTQGNDKGGKRAEYLYVDVNVFGPEDASEKVGALLSRRSVYLQDPHCLDSMVKYSNPHVLDLDISQVDIYFQQLEMDLATGTSKAGNKNDWNTVLDDLPQQHNFDATVVKVSAAVVKTPTMPHQGEALDFMCKREIGGHIMDNELRFWKLDRNQDGVPVYRHTITADERYQPQPEPKGGILADDMGLGKTLTSISLIVCSLDRATYFAQEHTRAAQGGNESIEAFARSRATLVVVPSTQLMDSWKKELEKHTCPGTLKISKYHGHDRVRHFSELMLNEIVLTTYGTIATEARKTRRKVLFHMEFFRIILDEAHTIRSRHTKLFKAITALNAAHHWCLTGTPISNRIDDLGALLEFCKVPLLEDRKCFQRYVSAEARKSAQHGYDVLKKIFKPICLRRTRALLNIAQPKVTVNEIVLSNAEQKQYRQILDQSRKAIDDAVSGRTGASTRHVMLRVLLQLRIFCNQGTFTPAAEEDPDHALDADEHLTLLEEKEEAFCDACSSVIAMVNQLEDLTSGVLGHCSHVLCRTCYDDLEQDIVQPGEYRCPICNEVVNQQCSAGQDEVATSSLQHSSKLSALAKDLLLSQNSETPEKSIVFSAWRKTLNIAATICTQEGIRYVRIDGTTPSSERSQVLQQFTHDPTISALLMTMGTGALGLNITAASRVHILEPQWNPAVEDQAVGRAVRLGQTRDATVIRYIVKDSVEKQIQGYQNRKMRLAAGGFEHRNESYVPDGNTRLNAAFITRA